jgi:hypothetical protein
VLLQRGDGSGGGAEGVEGCGRQRRADTTARARRRHTVSFRRIVMEIITVMMMIIITIVIDTSARPIAVTP